MLFPIGKWILYFEVNNVPFQNEISIEDNA